VGAKAILCRMKRVARHTESGLGGGGRLWIKR